MERCYALFSGGFDSSLAIVKYLNEHPNIRLTPVFFNYGQKSAEKEKQAVARLTERFKQLATVFSSTVDDFILVKLGDANEEMGGLFSWSKSSILKGRPDSNELVGLGNRNMVLLACLISLILSNSDGVDEERKSYIITGFTNGFYDTSSAFIGSLNQLFKGMGFHIEVLASLLSAGQKSPVGENKLVKLVDKYAKSIPLDEMSWSCYFPMNDKKCDDCEPCRKRQRIFMKVNMKRVKKIRHM